MTMQVKPEVVDGVLEGLVAQLVREELYQKHKIMVRCNMDSIRESILIELEKIQLDVSQLNKIFTGILHVEIRVYIV